MTEEQSWNRRGKSHWKHFKASHVLCNFILLFIVHLYKCPGYFNSCSACFYKRFSKHYSHYAQQHDSVNDNTYIMLILFYNLGICLFGEDLNSYNYEPNVQRVYAEVLQKPVNDLIWESTENDLWRYNKSMQGIPRSADL